MNNKFLENFNPVSENDWEVIVPGWIGKLSLKGPNGALDLIIVYLPSGSDAEKKKLRMQYMEALGRKILPKNEVLTLMMGDFNFVTRTEDRISKDTGAPSGDKDKEEAQTFEQLLGQPHELFELELAHF